ncbi:MAG: D-alanyl-D-alanine carboxypeptidase [Clostridia bacterium]|nr:D-alanyl-D-alanine carboxypeptidase [Clostridia bacterium]
MSIKRFLAFSIALLSLFLFPCQGQAPAVSAKHAVLIEATSGKVLYEKDGFSQAPMASTTKIMTALLAIESGDLGRTVSIAPEAIGIEGSSIYLKADETLTMEELVYAVMLQSANDAATAIACEIAGDTESFAALMNQKAEELGLENTHFTNPHGLDDEEHYTTAYDLAKLTAYALENEKFAEIVSTVKKVIPLSGTEGSRVLVNHNRLLRSFSDVIGVKTGFTKRSGRCLVSAAENNGIRVIAVTLNAPDDWNDHRELLDYGFDSLEIREIASVGDYVLEVDCAGGTKSKITATNSTSLSLIMQKGEAEEIRAVNELPRFVFAPVRRGQKLGEIVFYSGDKVLGAVDVIANETVEPITYKNNILEKIKSFFAA